MQQNFSFTIIEVRGSAEFLVFERLCFSRQYVALRKKKRLIYLCIAAFLEADETLWE